MKNYLSRRNNDLGFGFFDEVFDDFFKPNFFGAKQSAMKTDIKELENGFDIAIDMPGFDKKDIELTLQNGYLKGEAKREEKYIELSSIGVAPTAKSKGIGSKLVDYLKETEKTSDCEYICLETDAENNDGANAFYVKNGFTLEREYTTKEDRKMNEYRYYLEKTE